MIECISVSNDYDMADMKFLYHKGLPFSCDNCTIDEQESRRKSQGSQNAHDASVLEQRWD